MSQMALGNIMGALLNQGGGGGGGGGMGANNPAALLASQLAFAQAAVGFNKGPTVGGLGGGGGMPMGGNGGGNSAPSRDFDRYGDGGRGAWDYAVSEGRK